MWHAPSVTQLNGQDAAAPHRGTDRPSESDFSGCEGIGRSFLVWVIHGCGAYYRPQLSSGGGLMTFNYGGRAAAPTASGAYTKVLRYILGLLTGIYYCHGWRRDAAGLLNVKSLKSWGDNFAGGFWLKW